MARRPTERPPGLRGHVWSAVKSDGLSGVTIVVGSVMHAAGHAFLAAAAGILARTLAGDPALSIQVLGRTGSPDRPVLMLAIAGFCAALVKLVGGVSSSWGEARLAGEVGASVRLQVLGALLALRRLQRPRHDDHGRGTDHQNQAEQFAALTSHIADVERGVAHGVVAELRAWIQLAPLGVLLVVLAPRLAGSAVIALAGFGLLAFSLRRAFKQAHARATQSAAVLVGAADEAVKHAELWITYGAQRRIRAHVARVGRSIVREATRIAVRASLLSSTSEVLGALALVLALLLAARGYLGVERATVVPFAIAFFMAYKPLRDLVDARIARARGEEALRAALDDVEEEDAPASEPTRTDASWSLERLVFDAARTLHGQHAPLSLEVPPGSIVAVVGPTGVGKTSLLRGLLGLDPLSEGQVRYGPTTLVGGVGPGERPFAWVPQDAPVVSDTLAVNVGLGRADDDVALPDPGAILAALGNAELATMLGDSVLTTSRPLSGGERQWIAVARALATGLPVLLLDEPTSALDPKSQARLLEALSRLRGQRTIVIVTHRPEPLAIADRIIHLAPDRGVSDQTSATSSTGPAVTVISSERKRSPSIT